MQFLVIAKDGTDAEAPARRLAVREQHLVGARKQAEDGVIVAGGAILDDEGRMVGSAVIYEAPDRAALDAIIAADPYVTGGVWRDIEIKPFRLAVRSKP
ncbi:YciI family protein [Inquilinus limosus]|uniref:YciI family protein n=1 Tax=Inquilinus limosus TaxID=171674 RepID=UPI000404FBC2|nr:YciI family protein [Inquilinus limosus]